jgi:glycosyltransferase involved in cell wall biosynthesis
VFNQAAAIVANLEVIRERLNEELDGDFEIVAVSDGSIDATEAELLAHAPAGAFRVFHYDRNLGKGYAIKLGALEARGEWIGFVDADLDLDPRDLGTYVKHAQEEGLDFAIGSKRHPDSVVEYPPVRVAASWLFQQLVRLLFRLNVRDTQVGLKVFRREIAEQVLPFLLVKRFAFDIELLAVSRAFGFDRIGEMPVSLDYKFTGSGVRSRAVLRALIDTAAIFYRLRILRYYQRRRSLAGAYGWSRPSRGKARVSVLAGPNAAFRDVEGGELDMARLTEFSTSSLQAAARDAQGDVLAILEPGARAAGNWLSATVPFLARGEIVAVACAKIAPLDISPLERAAAAVDESRIGAGLGYFRYTPGNVRFVRDFATHSMIIRRAAFLELNPELDLNDVIAALAASGGRVLYTPETVIVVTPPRLFSPHLRVVADRGRNSVRGLRRGTFSWVHATLMFLAATLFGVSTILALALGGAWTDLLVTLLVLYAVAVGVAAAAAGLRHQSIIVGLLTALAIPCTHGVWALGFVRGVFDR